jgi:two-component system, OmpR family, sensor kinase
MGRLFWKLFAVIWLAMCGMFGVGYTLHSLGLETMPQPALASAEARFAILTAQKIIEQAGPEAARPLQEAWAAPVFGIELRVWPCGETAELGDERALQAQASYKAQNYELDVRPRATETPWGFISRPILAAAFLSFVTAMLLAQYLSHPIRLLRLALHSVAEGRFETRIRPLIGSRRDELADLGREADRMAAQLQQFSAQQKRLLHDVSHELRSPLARMKAATGVARQSPARAQDMMARIDREVERLDFLVDEILTLARLGSGAGELERASIDVIDLLTAVIDDAAFEGQARGVRIAFEVAGSFVSNVNGEAIGRGFENVIRNAIKFTDEGSWVRVQAEEADDGEALLVRVSDQGPGVSPDQAETIFEPFQKSASGELSTGHGLGLAIAKQAIECHGGSIRASQSESGRGLMVEIVVPRLNAL